MSSTLFARGINSQVGMKRRTDEMNKNIAGLKNDMTLIKQTSDDIMSLKNVIAAMGEKIAAIEKKVDSFLATAAAAATASANVESAPATDSA